MILYVCVQIGQEASKFKEIHDYHYMQNLYIFPALVLWSSLAVLEFFNFSLLSEFDNRKLQFTMRKNLLTFCHLVSISKNVVFYAFLVVRIYWMFSKFENIYKIFSKFAQNAVYICKISIDLIFFVTFFS